MKFLFIRPMKYFMKNFDALYIILYVILLVMIYKFNSSKSLVKISDEKKTTNLNLTTAINIPDINAKTKLKRNQNFNSSNTFPLPNKNINIKNKVKAVQKPSFISLEQKMYPDFRNCSKPELNFKYIQKRNYWVLQNYIKATRRFRCDESVTFTTIGEIGYLNNLLPVIERWQVSKWYSIFVKCMY